MSVEITNNVRAPNNLDEDYFQEVIENSLLEADVTLKKINFEMGLGGEGENHCSQIYKVKLTFQRSANKTEESMSVFVKIITPSEDLKFLEDLSVFLKEKIAYTNILPKMEVLLDGVVFAPKLYHGCRKPISTLTFEDLSASGYVVMDREKGLDLNHCKVVLRKLGQFHAVSMIVAKKEPRLMNSFQFGLLGEKAVEKGDFYEFAYGNMMKGLIEVVSTWEGYEAIVPKLKKYSANFKENLIKCQKPLPGDLKVLNHGDLWVNNLLFKHSKDARKEVVDVLFIDFQLSLYGSPGIDLNYFLNSSTQLDVLKNHREELINIYYAALNETLSAHDVKNIPSYEEILTEINRRENYGFFVTFAILSTIAMEKDRVGAYTLAEFKNQDSAKRLLGIIFSTKRLVETLKYTLKRFDELGVFD